MSRRKKIPSYRLHRQSGQGIVTLTDATRRRKDVLLGKFNSKESRAEYCRVIKEWEIAGQNLPSERGTATTDLTINELLLAYLGHAQRYYVKDGVETSEVDSIRQAIRFVKDLYGATLARDFGPLALKVVRQAMIDHKITRKCKNKTVVLAQGLSRGNINKQIARIKRLFSWAVENELVPPATFQALAEVAGLRKGRTGAREKPPVKPVPPEAVQVRPCSGLTCRWSPFLLPRLAASPFTSRAICSERSCQDHRPRQARPVPVEGRRRDGILASPRRQSAIEWRPLRQCLGEAKNQLNSRLSTF